MLPRSLYFVGAWARVSATGRFGVRGLGSLGAAPGLGPPPGHAVRPRRVGLRPLLPWPRRAATRRRRARAGPFGVQRAGQLFVGIRVLLIADGSSFGVRHVSPDQFAQRSGPRCGRLTSSFLLWHRESCTAPRRVAVEFNAFSGSVVINHTCIRRCCGPRVEGSGTGGGTELSKRQPPQQCAKCDSYRSARATKCAPP